MVGMNPDDSKTAELPVEKAFGLYQEPRPQTDTATVIAQPQPQGASRVESNLVGDVDSQEPWPLFFSLHYILGLASRLPSARPSGLWTASASRAASGSLTEKEECMVRS